MLLKCTKSTQSYFIHAQDSGEVVCLCAMTHCRRILSQRCQETLAVLSACFLIVFLGVCRGVSATCFWLHFSPGPSGVYTYKQGKQKEHDSVPTAGRAAATRSYTCLSIFTQNYAVKHFTKGQINMLQATMASGKDVITSCLQPHPVHQDNTERESSIKNNKFSHHLFTFTIAYSLQTCTTVLLLQNTKEGIWNNVS